LQEFVGARRWAWTLDLMTTAPGIARLTAASLLGLAAVFPAGIVGLYLFHARDWQDAFSVAMAPDSPIRYQFPLLIVGAVLSLAGAVSLAVSHHRVIFRIVLAVAVALSLTYAVLGAWSLMLVSALPFWWLYKAWHEV
jgi:hypothetical protein